MSLVPAVTMEDWMRQTQKDTAIQKRRPNPLWRTAALENRGLLNKIINGDFRINQIGYVSAAALPPGSYCFDGWRASGLMNKMPNSTGGSATTGWAGTNSTISRLTGLTIPGLTGVTTAIRGTAIAAVTGGLYRDGDANVTASLRCPLVPGRTYRVSAWLRASVAKTVTNAIQWTNAALGSLGSTTYGTQALLANTWTRVTFLVPLGTTTLALPVNAGPYWYSTANWAIGNTLDVAGLMIVDTQEDPDYFDGSFTDGSWAGTAHLSASYSVAVVPTVTYVTAPQGQMVTLNSGAKLNETLERANMPAGDYIVGHSGTAQIRVYNKGSAPPVFAAGPIGVTLDGTSDVVVEFYADGGTATLGEVFMFPGSTAYPFEPRPLGQELALCRRRFYRLSNDNAQQFQRLSNGFQQSTTATEAYFILPEEMRTSPFIYMSAVSWTDGVGFTASVARWLSLNALSGVKSITQQITIAANGAASRPGAVVSSLASLGYIDFDANFYGKEIP